MIKSEPLNNGDIKLSSERGIIDLRINRVYSEVIISKELRKYFIEVPVTKETHEKKSKTI